MDVRVEPPPSADDVMSLAAVHYHVAPAHPAVFDNVDAVHQDHNMHEVDVDEMSVTGDEDSFSSISFEGQDEDWRFAHICLLGKRIVHGRIP